MKTRKYLPLHFFPVFHLYYILVDSRTSIILPSSHTMGVNSPTLYESTKFNHFWMQCGQRQHRVCQNIASGHQGGYWCSQHHCGHVPRSPCDGRGPDRVSTKAKVTQLVNGRATTAPMPIADQCCLVVSQNISKTDFTLCIVWAFNSTRLAPN